MNITPKPIGAKNVCSKEVTEHPVGLHDMRHGLVLDFPLNETEGDTAIDQSHKVPYIEGDPVDDEISIPSNPISGDFRIDVDLEYNNTETMFLGGTGDQKIGRWSNKLFFRVVNGGASNNAFLEPSNGRHTISITRESGVCKYLLDGEVQGALFTSNGNVDFTTLFHAGGQHWGGKIYGYRVYNNGVLQTAYNMLRKNNDDTTLPDISGNGNDGTVNGALFKGQPCNGDIKGDIARTNLRNLRALKFRALDYDNVSVPHSEDISFGAEDFSYSFIIKAPLTQTYDNPRVFTKGYNYYNYKHSATSASLVFRTYDGTHSVYKSLGGVFDDKIHLITIVHDRTNHKAYGYLDGEKKAVDNDTSEINYEATKGTSPLLIGGNSQYLDGFVAQPRIYNRALSDEEVQNQYLQIKSKL